MGFRREVRALANLEIEALERCLARHHGRVALDGQRKGQADVAGGPLDGQAAIADVAVGSCRRE